MQHLDILVLQMGVKKINSGDEMRNKEGRDAELIGGSLGSIDPDTAEKIRALLAIMSDKEIEGLVALKKLLKEGGIKIAAPPTSIRDYCENNVCSLAACVFSSSCSGSACTSNGCAANAGGVVTPPADCEGNSTCGNAACSSNSCASNAGGTCGNASCQYGSGGGHDWDRPEE
jgi:hypothetical protein